MRRTALVAWVLTVTSVAVCSCGPTQVAGHSLWTPPLEDAVAAERLVATRERMLGLINSTVALWYVMYPVGVRGTGTNWVIVDIAVAGAHRPPYKPGRRFQNVRLMLELECERGKGVRLSRPGGMGVGLRRYRFDEIPDSATSATLRLANSYQEFLWPRQVAKGPTLVDVGVISVAVLCDEVLVPGEMVDVAFDAGWGDKLGFKADGATRVRVEGFSSEASPGGR